MENKKKNDKFFLPGSSSANASPLPSENPAADSSNPAAGSPVPVADAFSKAYNADREQSGNHSGDDSAALPPPETICGGDRPIPIHVLKDSVFKSLFGRPEYLLQLYQALHPEDDSVTESDLRSVTIRNILISDVQNDLGFTVKGRQLLLVEAQSTWSDNIVLRLFIYLAQTWGREIKRTRQSTYAGKKVSISRPECYVIYTGEGPCPERLSLADAFLDGDKESAELKVKVLSRDDRGTIIGQYIRFCRVYNHQMQIYGRTVKAVKETLRICKEEDILSKFILENEEELFDSMSVIFSPEYNIPIVLNEAREIGREEGLAEGQEKSLKRVVLNMHALGRSDEEIAESVGCSPETVQTWIQEAAATAC